MVRATKILSVCLSVIAIYTNNVLFFLESINILFLFFFLFSTWITYKCAPHHTRPGSMRGNRGLSHFFFFTIYSQ